MQRTIPCLILVLALAARAAYFSDWLYLSDSELTPANGLVNFYSGDLMVGRMHTNGELRITTMSWPEIGGPVTSVMCDVFSISPSDLPAVFPQGFRGGFDRAVFPEEAEILTIAGQAEPGHRFPGRDADSLQLTTWIQFDQASYHVSQYTQEGVQGLDTSYVLPWETRALPASPGVIWVQGVARIQGVIAGQLTVVASDTLFLTGDLVTEDVILNPCGSPQTFGTVPAGSPNRIGLISLSQVLIAATTANGLGDGANAHPWQCPSPYPPVITVCGQDRRDIVITAAILALGCGYGVEFWKSSVTPNPAPVLQPNCSGWSDTHAQRIECGQDATTPDYRGTIWLAGSIAFSMRGYSLITAYWQNPLTPVGYQLKHWRHDPNLLDSPPPYWPELIWEDEDPLEIEPSEIAQSLCGMVEDPDAFRVAWDAGLIHLTVAPSENALCPDESVRLGIWLDGLEVAHSDTVVATDTALELIPGLVLPPDGTHTLHLELAWDTQVWNRGGELCQYQIEFTDVAEDRHAGPQAFELAVFPNPFNPGTKVSFNLPARETLRLVVHDLTGRRIRVLELGSLPAGSQGVYWDGRSDGGQDAPSGVYFLGIEGGSGRLGVVKALLVR